MVEDSIKHSLRKNGFPGNRVSLPFKPVYDSCRSNGTWLADVLKNLAEEQIFATILGNRIEFRSTAETPRSVDRGDVPRPTVEVQEPSTGSAENPMQGMSDMARAVAAQMTPEQMQEIGKMVNNLSDEEKQNIINLMAQWNVPPSTR